MRETDFRCFYKNGKNPDLDTNLRKISRNISRKGQNIFRKTDVLCDRKDLRAVPRQSRGIVQPPIAPEPSPTTNRSILYLGRSPKTPFRIRISPRRRHDKTETASPPQSNTTGKQPKKFRKTERSSPPLSRKFLSAHNDARLAPTKTGPRPSGRSPAANSPRRKVSHCRPQHPSYRATRW